MAGVLLAQADALHLPLRDKSVQCIVSSPPYWGLRDYNTGRWLGGASACNHSRRTSMKEESVGTNSRPTNTNHEQEGWRGGICGKCGAVREYEQLGLEKLHDCAGAFTGTSCGACYVCHLRQVAQELWRVLRDDGTFWLNLGDSMSSGGRVGHGTRQSYKQQTNRGMNGTNDPPRLPQPPGLKPKDLVGVPWRVALALQADGWFLRCDVIWEKPNCFPSSVKDRPTRSHEYLFLLTKSPQYFYDAQAIAEEVVTGANGSSFTSAYDVSTKPGLGMGPRHDGLTRNARSVWTINTESFHGQHFATMPTALVERCIRAGSATGDTVCDPFCGSGTVPLVARALGRHSVGLDLSLPYLRDEAKKRLGFTDLEAWEKGGKIQETRYEDLPLFRHET